MTRTWILDPDITIEDPEVQSLVLDTDIRVHVHLTSITKKSCANCGSPASTALRDLDQQERVFLCAGCGRVRR